MKTLIIILFSLLLLNATGWAQKGKGPENTVRVEGIYIKDTSVVYKPLTTLLRTVPQLVRITSNYYPHLTAESDNGTIIDMENNFFTIKPEIIGKLTLKIYKDKNHKDKDPLAVYEYDVIKGPVLKSIFAESNIVTRKSFLTDSIIHFNTDTMLLPYKFQVASFKISIIKKGADPIFDIPSDGNRIPELAKNIIKEMPAGTKIFFESINANFSEVRVAPNAASVHLVKDGTRSLEAMSFIISDE